MHVRSRLAAVGAPLALAVAVLAGLAIAYFSRAQPLEHVRVREATEAAATPPASRTPAQATTPEPTAITPAAAAGNSLPLPGERPPAEAKAPSTGQAQSPAAGKTAAPPRPEAIVNPRVAVLTYHAVRARVDGPFTVTPERLRSDLQWFLEHGWQPLTLAAFQEWMEGTRQLIADAFLLTFDDGYADFLTDALPVLKELEVPAVLFVISKSLGPDPSTGVKFLTAEELDTVARSGLVSIESHTHELHFKPEGASQPAVFSLRPDELARDLDASIQRLTELAGRRPTALAWPQGSAPAWASLLARERFALVFTGSSGFVELGRREAIRRFPMEWRRRVHLEHTFGRP